MKQKISIVILCLALGLPLSAQTTEGDIWIYPAEPYVGTGETFTTEIHINTGSRRLALISLTIQFNPEVITMLEVEGTDENFDPIVGGGSPGVFIVQVFSATGFTPSSDLHWVTIRWKTLNPGGTYIHMKPDSISDINYIEFNSGNINTGLVHVPGPGQLWGDVNADNRITILDALMIAQHSVGLPVSGFNPEVGDANCDGIINIIDALIAARYYIGLEVTLPCHGYSEPIPNSPILNLPDPALEMEVRTELNIFEGALYLRDTEGVKDLDLQAYNISNLTGLEHFKDLRYLRIWTDEILDLSPLAQLNGLIELDMSQVRHLNNLDVLAELINLRILDFSMNALTALPDLGALINLEKLILTWNNLDDISFLAGLTNLTDLDLMSNEISGLSPLAGLTNLQRLSLSHNSITDVSPLAGLTELTILYLAGNDLTDVNPLASLVNLEELYLAGHHASAEDIAALQAALPDTYIDF